MFSSQRLPTRATSSTSPRIALISVSNKETREGLRVIRGGELSTNQSTSLLTKVK